MEQYEFLKDKAMEKIRTADHMLYITYPLIKDPKLLIVVLQNIFASLDYCIGAILHKERLSKRIPGFLENYDSRFKIFNDYIVPMHKLPPNYAKLISDVKQLLSAHTKSPVSFVKKDKYVICSSKYEINSVDANLIKKYLLDAKLFVKKTNEIVGKT